MGVALWLINLSLRSNGSASCDFAGQWLLGRQIVERTGNETYYASKSIETLKKVYQGEAFDRLKRDIFLKGHYEKLPEDDIEGALYPPTAALLFSAFGSFDPAVAHGVTVLIYVQLIFVCGYFLSQMVKQKLQWSELNLILLLFPNNYMGLLLGQNQIFTLAILILGWYLISKGKPFWAGIMWALLAYKPVFALPLGVFALLLPSIRVPLGMACGGLLFALLTLPFVGIDGWMRWYHVGKNADKLYRVDRNWIWMSRDVMGLARRKMWTQESIVDHLRYNFGTWKPGARLYLETEKGPEFSPAIWLLEHDEFNDKKHQSVEADWLSNLKPELFKVKEGEPPSKVPDVVVPLEWADRTSWWLFGIVVGSSLLICLVTIPVGMKQNWEERATHPRSSFLLLSALLSVFHFMHYDLLSFALPLLLLICHTLPKPGKLRGTFWLLWAFLWGCFSISYIYGDGILRLPWETYLLLMLWLMLGLRTLFWWK